MGDGEHTNPAVDYGFNLGGDKKRKRMEGIRKEEQGGEKRKK